MSKPVYLFSIDGLSADQQDEVAQRLSKKVKGTVLVTGSSLTAQRLDTNQSFPWVTLIASGLLGLFVGKVLR